MLSTKKPEQEVIMPLLQIFCKPDPRCCMDGKTCPATYTMNSSGQTAFYKCSCM